MIERQVTIPNRLGLHARAAAKLVHTAGAFDSDVALIRNGETIDAKSILGILLLAAEQGAEIVVRCSGEDERAAIDAVTELIATGFGEDG